MKNYFVMIHLPNGHKVPMMENEDRIAWFETQKEAKEAGEYYLGDDRGCFYCEVFEIGTGEFV